MDLAIAALPRAATLASSLTDRLVTAIAVGSFSPGERLPAERDLAERLGVSRETLRQALGNVAELGLIDVRRGRGGGSFVAEESWVNVAPQTARRVLEVELPRLAELFDYRCLVEGMIARAAAERRTPDDVRAMRAILAELTSCGKISEERTHDRRLHAQICTAARNPHLATLSAGLTVAVTLGFGAEPYEPEPDLMAKAVNQHDELIEHIARGDADAAGRCAQQHFELTLETMQTSLRRASNADPDS